MQHIGLVTTKRRLNIMLMHRGEAQPYQRALKLSPANDDILHNIEITSNKTVDRLPVETDVFIVKWYKSLVCSLPIDTWAVTALVTLAFSLICYLLYLFMENINVRRISFFSSVVLCLLFLSPLSYPPGVSLAPGSEGMHTSRTHRRSCRKRHPDRGSDL